jgi:mannose-1-phosphate guanylyltransferase
MRTPHTTWAIVLAAGDGTRLRNLTTDAKGRATPKQYCSLFGGATLLQDALHRARALVGREQLCAIVAEDHAAWWRGALWSLPPGNVFSQPRNRGTGNGVLLALLSVLERDPMARVVFLPADHFVEDEDELARALRVVIGGLDNAADELVLLGLEPDEPDPELGYIVPGAAVDNARRVARFIEKPSAAIAAELVGDGALWNSFIFAARGAALLGLFRERMAGIVDAMETALARGGEAARALAEVYELLPEVDFSRHIVEGAASRMRVVAAPPCGWTDLGTARRVGDVVRRVTNRAPRGAVAAYLEIPEPVNLAVALRKPYAAP